MDHGPLIMRTGRDHILIWLIGVIPLLVALTIPLSGMIRRMCQWMSSWSITG